MKTASELTYTVSSGALNSTPTNDSVAALHVVVVLVVITMHAAAFCIIGLHGLCRRLSIASGAGDAL